MNPLQAFSRLRISLLFRVKEVAFPRGVSMRGRFMRSVFMRGVFACAWAAWALCAACASGDADGAAAPDARVSLRVDADGVLTGTFRYSLVTGRFYEWNTDPTAIPGLFDEVRKRTDVAPVLATEAVGLDSPRLARNPLVILTGNRVFRLTDGEIESLRRYLRGGGFLYADDCGGSDLSFRRMLKQLFPDKTLRELPRDHAVFRKPYRVDGVPKVIDLYRGPATAFGLEIDGRLAVLYTYDTDIACAWETYPDGSYVHVVPPERREEAFRFGVNVVMLALRGRVRDTDAPPAAAAPEATPLPEDAVTVLRMEKRLPCLRIRAFADDGRFVWMGGHALLPGEDEGLARYDTQTDRWRLYRDAEGMLAEEILALAVHDGRVLVGADTWKFSKGLSVFEPEARRRRTYTVEDGLPHHRVVGVVVRKDAVWAACRQGLGVLAPGAERFEEVEIPGGPSAAFCIDILATERGVWLDTFEDVLFHSPEKKTWTSASERTGLFSGHAAAMAAAGGRVWIAPAEPEDAAVVVCDEAALRFRSFDAFGDLGAPVTALTAVPAMRIDGKGFREEVWAGLADGTVVRCESFGGGRYSQAGATRYDVGDGPVRRIHVCGKHVFIASGLFDGVTHLRRDTGDRRRIGTRAVLPSDMCFAVDLLGDGLVIGTVADGPWLLPAVDGAADPVSLNVELRKDGEPFDYLTGTDVTRYASVYDCAVGDGVVWMATNHGLVLHDPETTPRGFTIPPGTGAALRSVLVTAGRIFCGHADGGVHAVDPEDGRPTGEVWLDDDPVAALAWFDGELLVGGAEAVHRLAMTDDGPAEVGAIDMPSRDLLADGERLWIAAADGVRMLRRNDDADATPLLFAPLPGVTRLCRGDEMLFAAGGSTLHVLSGLDGKTPQTRSFDLSAQTGVHAVTDMVCRDGALYVVTLGGGMALIDTARLDAARNKTGR